MKQLLLMLIFIGCFANAQDSDSAVIARKIDSLERVQQNIKKLTAKIDGEKVRRKSLLKRLEMFIERINSKQKTADETVNRNDQATKTEHFDPYVVNDRYKIELVPRKWSGRLFSRYDFRAIIKPVNE